MKADRRRSLRRNLKAGWRDTLILFREFRSPLLLFVALILGSGILYFTLARNTTYSPDSISESIYLALTLTFLQSSGDFPPYWYLQIFYFILPILGIGVLAQGLADFGIALFNRRVRGKEWEMAVASTYSNHIILVGLGHLGFRVVKNLNEMDQDVVVIELDPQHELVSAIQEMGIPVIHDDGTRETALSAAGITRARSILLCTQNDSLNLQMAVKARSLNPIIEVIVRIFDDDFAQSLQTQFGFKALSATGMAAPVFAASAANVDITPPISIDGEPNSLARIEISNTSPLLDQSLDSIENQYHVSIVLHSQSGQIQHHPAGIRKIIAGDSIVALGHPTQLNSLVHDAQK